jgi:hypothetical protein
MSYGVIGYSWMTMLIVLFQLKMFPSILFVDIDN